MSPGPVDGFDLDAAAALMSRHVGAPVALEPTSGPRGRHHFAVVRCRFSTAAAMAPGTVIVKQAPGGPDGAHLALFNEWAALAFLSRLELDSRVSPAFYGRDVSSRLLVLEDLGDGKGLWRVPPPPRTSSGSSRVSRTPVPSWRLYTAMPARATSGCAENSWCCSISVRADRTV